MVEFHYQPLDASKNEIRLLFPQRQTVVKFPLGWQDPFAVIPDLSLDFELRAVSQDNNPTYTALSYVWGHYQASKTITVNGSAFPITESLETALRHMSHENIQPAIWIDAICINQNDPDEKSDQVPRMSRIYSNAREILVWLGPGTEYNQQNVNILTEAMILFKAKLGTEGLKMFMREHVRYASARGHSKDDCELLKAFFLAIRNVGHRGSAFLQSVPDVDNFTHWWESSVLGSGWWYRVWTIQEYVLARSCHFQIGVCKINFVFMLYAWDLMRCISYSSSSIEQDNVARRLEPQNNSNLLDRLLRLRQVPKWTLPQTLREDLGKSPKFFDILMTAYCDGKFKIGCSDARDRIFGLASLAEEDYGKLRIQINYRKQMWEVYTDVSRRLILSGELDVISICHRQDSTQAPPNVASWAIDWSKPIAEPHPWFKDIRNSLFSASGKSDILASFHDLHATEVASGASSVILGGMFVDEVAQIGRTECGHEGNAYNLNTSMTVSLSREIEEFCKISQSISKDLYKSSQLREAGWRIPIWDHEQLYDEPWRRATKLSKARYIAHLNFGLAENEVMTLDSLGAERGAYGVFRNLWVEVLCVFHVYKMRFYWAHYLPHWDIFAYRILYWVYIPWYILLFRCKWVTAFQEGSMEQTAQSVNLYNETIGRGRRNRLIVTKRGYIGLAPTTACVGDSVFVFSRSRVPHVLRKREDGQPGYTLVGDAFVYGIMDGELIEDGVAPVGVEIF